MRNTIFPCPIPGVGSSAFVCPACRRGALMVVSGLHGDARTGSKLLLRARRRLESPPVFSIPSRRLFVLALSSVVPAYLATPTSALNQARVEPRKKFLFISSFVPAASVRRPFLRRTREPCSIPSSSRWPGPSAPSCSPAPPRPAKDRRFRAETPIG